MTSVRHILHYFIVSLLTCKLHKQQTSKDLIVENNYTYLCTSHSGS
jgi:hypothetical protein